MPVAGVKGEEENVHVRVVGQVVKSWRVKSDFPFKVEIRWPGRRAGKGFKGWREVMVRV